MTSIPPESARELRERETDALVANLREAIKDRKMPIRLSVADTRAILDRLDTSAPADVGKLIDRLRQSARMAARGWSSGVKPEEFVEWEAADALARLSRAADGPAPAVSEVEVEAAAQVIADSPLIDAPKLPAPCWRGLARACLEAAQRARK